MRDKAERRRNEYIKTKRKKEIYLNSFKYYISPKGEVSLSKETPNIPPQYYKNYSYSNHYFKTKNKGSRRLKKKNYAPSINYSASDKRKQDALDYQIKENLENKI